MTIRALDKDGNVIADSEDAGSTWTVRGPGDIASIVMGGTSAGILGSLLDRGSASGRCATCRWAEVVTALPGPTYPLMCRRISAVASWVDGESYAPPPNALAETDENDGGYARLFVAPDFGCVQWEARPDA